MSKSARYKATWTTHLAVFAVAQLVFALTDNSWALAALRDAVPDDQPVAMIVSKIWLFVFAGDTVWSWWSIAEDRKKAAAARSARHPLVTRGDEQR